MVTAHWLHVRDEGRQDCEIAEEDYADVQRADVLIAFTEGPSPGATRGGRHVELGLALAWGKRIILVGPRENVFCHMHRIQQVDEWYQVTEEMIEGARND